MFVEENAEEILDSSEERDVDDEKLVEEETAAAEQIDSTVEASEVDDEEISEDQLDDIADTAIDVIQQILASFDVNGAEINEYEGEDRELILDIVGGDLAILIGRHGATLDALQTLVTSMTRQKLGYRYPITIDVESYKHRQRQKLETMACNAADRAVRQDRDVNLRSMNSYERRIIHMTLRDDERVETFSEGTDPNRHVIVRPL